MCDDGRPQVGRIGWTDLTVDNAEELRDFYGAVVGWEPDPVDMGEYADFNMTVPGEGTPAAGICHARGNNAARPAPWMVHITVADHAASLGACADRGGTIVAGPSGMGSRGRYAVIQDPAGAVAALFEPRELSVHADHHHHEHGHDHATEN